MVRLFARDDAHGLRAAPARVMGRHEVAAALAVCAVDPVTAALAAARVADWPEQGARGGGSIWAYPSSGPPTAICWSGANLFPVVPETGPEREAALDAFAAAARLEGRRSSSIVGDAAVALGLWERLAPVWPRPREIRACQPSMAIARDPDVAPDPAVRRGLSEELGAILPACVRMFVEEVGYSPVVGGSSAYERRVRQLIATGRSFVRMERGADERPFVAFKAELGAVTEQVAQIQGVWVDPTRRGHRLSENGVAAVVVAARRDVAPVVSLYVNDFNAPAIAAYRRVGFEQVGTLATILF
ncbi:GNAT family N-acetyltransferase [Luteimicrobium sp. NPDC057192]|uniref:GNAT family N-acetyltransferase n=1 Tax=Luteimicrobium sp. NPDC057192 TaxID=3346042 RepID=UPI0036330198